MLVLILWFLSTPGCDPLPQGGPGSYPDHHGGNADREIGLFGVAGGFRWHRCFVDLSWTRQQGTGASVTMGVLKNSMGLWRVFCYHLGVNPLPAKCRCGPGQNRTERPFTGIEDLGSGHSAATAGFPNRRPVGQICPSHGFIWPPKFSGKKNNKLNK